MRYLTLPKSAVERGKEVPDLPMDTEAPKAGTITEATATAHDKISLKWTAGTDNKTPEKELEYELSFYNMSTGEYKSSGSLIGVTSYEFKATPNTEYTILLSVSDEAGNSTDYETQIVTTPAAPGEDDKEAPKVGAITEVTVTELYSLNLKWTAATDNKTPLEDLRYQVFWKAEGSTEVKNSGEPKAAMFNYKIDILAPNTSYTVWVEVFDKANNKAKYPEKTFTTDTAYIELTTYKKVGEKVELYIEVEEADKAGVWLDLNNNNKWDEGIDLKPTISYETMEFPLQTQTFRIYGKIYELKCNSQELKAIDIHNTVLKDLNVHSNLIPSIPSIAHLKLLKALDIDTHTLYASSVPKGLIYLYLKETVSVSTIDTSPLTELILLNVQDCKSLKRLDLRNNKKLIRLYADNSGLTELDLSQQPELIDLDLRKTPLTKLNIAGNKALIRLYANNSRLTELDLSQKPELTDLNLRDTPLTKLNIAGNKALKTVIIENTKLQGTALMDFIKQLPTREEGKKGEIFLSRTQGTKEVERLLASKYWDMIVSENN